MKINILRWPTLSVFCCSQHVLWRKIRKIVKNGLFSRQAIASRVDSLLMLVLTGGQQCSVSIICSTWWDHGQVESSCALCTNGNRWTLTALEWSVEFPPTFSVVSSAISAECSSFLWQMTPITRLSSVNLPRHRCALSRAIVKSSEREWQIRVRKMKSDEIINHNAPSRRHFIILIYLKKSTFCVDDDSRLLQKALCERRSGVRGRRTMLFNNQLCMLVCICNHLIGSQWGVLVSRSDSSGSTSSATCSASNP